MNKHKFKKKKGLATLVIKGQKNQQLMEREVYGINQNEVHNLLHPGVSRKGAMVDLTYDLTGYISLKEYLCTPLDRAAFIRLLQHILDILEEMKAAVYNQSCLMFDINFVMINPASKNVSFVFIPLQPLENDTNLRELLLSIVQYATFSAEEDNDYVREYINILNKGINFSTFELEQYVAMMSGRQGGQEAMVECPHCHIRLKKSSSYCTNCGAKLAEQSGALKKTTYDPTGHERGGYSTGQGVYGDGAEKGGTGGLSARGGEGTTVLGAYGGTTVLGIGDEQPSFPYLIRQRDQSRHTVDKPVFRIGKERQYCDYFISDNTAISRSHADIVTREGRYYIVDRNSTNHTYVDGRLIPAEREIELYHGTRVRLANEEFSFCMD